MLSDYSMSIQFCLNVKCNADLELIPSISRSSKTHRIDNDSIFTVNIYGAVLYFNKILIIRGSKTAIKLLPHNIL